MMKLVKLLVYSNFVVSLSVGTLTTGCAHYLGNKHSLALGFTAFLSTFFIYNIQRLLRLKGIHEDSSERLLWIKKHALRLFLASFISLIGCLITYFFFLGVELDFWFLALSGVFGILYAFEFTPKVEGLRDIPYIKIYLIALLWALVAVFWPSMRIGMHPLSYPLIFSVFFYILACTVPFDIRDMYYDDNKKKTIPQLVGQNGAKLVAILFLLVSAYSLYISCPQLIANPWFYVSYGGIFVLILGSSHKRPELYYSGIIDAWILFYAVCIFLLNFSSL